jgi:glutamate dehydrogenase
MHIFIDPTPDAAASYAERRRLFELPRSTWADYDNAVLSPGGGVYSRAAKSITLSPEARAALGIADEALTPNELIGALLKAPVDLLWNGGIGTYVKSSLETNSDVGDKANDSVRINGSELRCRVVGEGGNLGFTQAARVEFARRGGLIYTDAIDNSAGVNCSDREVNIKILLDAVVADGDLTRKQRDALLVQMTDEVAELVLEDNVRQTQAITNAVAESAPLLDTHQRYIRTLEQLGKLNREIEFLPGDEAFGDRRAAGEGLSAPELAVLLAYTKIAVYDDLVTSDAPDDPYLARELDRYFPPEIIDRFPDRLPTHRLRRQIIANVVTNDLVDRQGSTFAFRLADETGATMAAIARARTVARDVFDYLGLWAVVENLGNQVDAGVQTGMILDGRRLVERSTRWLLRHRRQPINIGAEVGRFAPGIGDLAVLIPGVLPPAEAAGHDATVARLQAAGVPAPLAARIAAFDYLSSGFDIVEVASAADEPVEAAAAVYFALDARLELQWLREQIVALPRENRWQTRARAALRDDLYALQRSLTAAVLAATPPGADAGARIDQWVAANQDAVQRAAQVAADVKAAGSANLAVLSVALRENHLLLSEP